jgi:hypothetical protein
MAAVALGVASLVMGAAGAASSAQGAATGAEAQYLQQKISLNSTAWSNGAKRI